MRSVSKQEVERLHQVFCSITELISQIEEDRQDLYCAAEKILEVGLKHDEAGGYGVFFQE